MINNNLGTNNLNILVTTIIKEVDETLQILFPPVKRLNTRPSPTTQSSVLSKQEKKNIGRLMRVNHAGEICAQALYKGQSLTTKNLALHDQMLTAAREEIDHLSWCEQHLRELESQPSLLNPCWYFGSIFFGLIAGLSGDKWSLAFIVETEKQVSAHLAGHLHQLPAHAHQTISILKQMQIDEETHATNAYNAGAAELPLFIKKTMHFTARIMTKISYYI